MASLVFPHLGDMPLLAIRSDTLQQWVSQLTVDGYSAETVRKAWQLASGALRAAVAARRIAHSPTEGVSLPKLEQGEQRFLSADEILSLADAIDPQYRCMVLLGGFAGLRFGEVCALKGQSFSELSRSITITETLTQVKGVIRVGPPKTKASRRSVMLPGFVVTELVEHLKTFPPGDNGLLFAAPAGGPISPTHWRGRVWKQSVRASVGEPLRFHELRHSHVALLIAQGEHPSVIASRLGHTSTRVVLDRYGHLFSGIDEAAADRLNDLVSNSRADATRTQASKRAIGKSVEPRKNPS